MRTLELSRGLVSVLDDADYDEFGHLKWYAQSGKTPYVVRNGARHGNGEREPLLYLHKEIMRPSQGFVTDHINGDPLDNRRANLRIVTQSRNMLNQKQIRGIDWNKGKWRARIKVDGVQLDLGRYSTFEEAVAARLCAESLYGVATEARR